MAQGLANYSLFLWQLSKQSIGSMPRQALYPKASTRPARLRDSAERLCPARGAFRGYPLEELMLLLLSVLGLLSGALTTVAGMGGGMLLVLALSLAMPPTLALTASAPALLLGNLHRLWTHWADVERRLAVAFAGGALLGSFTGGFLLTALPPLMMRALLAATTVFAVARALGALARPIRLPSLLLWPAGFSIGATAAASSGAGLLVSPLLMSNGLSGHAYVATSAAIAVAMHVGRLASYGVGGLLTRESLSVTALLTASILAGNVLGDGVRRFISPKAAIRIQTGMLVLCALLALAGFRA
jgi:uncharacterized membrane protein YfcA